MAFDIYVGERHVAIEEHESYIVGLGADTGRCPMLTRVATYWYEDPAFSPEEARLMIHELLSVWLLIEDEHDEYRPALRTISRLLPVLHDAYARDEWVRCVSD